MKRTGALLTIALAIPAAPAPHAEPEPVRVQLIDPRAFGYQAGDLAVRTIVIDVPRRLALVPASLPGTGRIGTALELRSVAHDSSFTLSGRRHTLRLQYQLFAAPVAPRLVYLPGFTLRFDGEPRPETWRIDDAALAVAPLVAQQAPLRSGLGELRPDVPPPIADSKPERRRLAAYALFALLPLCYLLAVYVGAPAWRSHHRPFAQAHRHLRRLAADAPAAEWLAAWRKLHAALDASAGRVLHAAAIDDFIAERPCFFSLRADLELFFERSQALFFAGQIQQQTDRVWLREFCRRCADAERGLS